MNKTKFIASAALAAVLFSTTALAYRDFKTPATSYIHKGDKVILNHSISTPGGEKIFLQNGKVKRRSEVGQSRPYCYFHLRRDRAFIDTETSLSSEDFTVIDTTKYNELVFNDQPLSQPRVILAMMDSTERGNSERTLTTRIYLTSVSQPQVIGLNCSVWAVPSERSHVSIDEIRKALGDLVTLELADY